jgi:ribosome-binding factor A
MSSDLRQATVYYTTAREERGRLRDATPEEAAEAAAALQGALPHLLPALGERVRLRYLPHLTFRLDDSPAIGARVEEIIQGWQAGPDDHVDGGAVQGEWDAER